MKKVLAIGLIALSVAAACLSLPENRRDRVNYHRFNNYWNQGKAEISSFELVQYRYGEERRGEAVLIFVTEDFSESRQVKLDNPAEASADAQKVLKLNKTVDFLTGIYPYHMMLSVFTPVHAPVPAVKLTASSQEWCGQTFTQFNRRGEKYQGQIFSYFEQEGDQQYSLEALPEDALWNLIRLDPEEVPKGRVMLIPALLNQRFNHVPLNEEEAQISVVQLDDEISTLRVDYTTYNRSLRIRYRHVFPFEILGWEEESTNRDGQSEISYAQRKAILLSDYWTRNKNADLELRRQLRLIK